LNNEMKTLSPSEHSINIALTINIPLQLSTSRVAKLISEATGLNPRIIRHDTVKVLITCSLDRVHEALDTYIKILNTLAEYADKGLNACVEYWFIVKNHPCPCKTRGDRVQCVVEYSGEYVKIYCNMSENYVSIRFLNYKPLVKPEASLIPASAFIKCLDINSLRSIVDEINNRALIVWSMLNDERPIRLDH